ncbi:MAG TPA: class I SAM-dependent methyltransferase [Acidobacteriota bacterium]|jgi:ubiquinone/menaquinone biosynthesis C-methylase UbiE|nr:class I SAM-dependent methyltransferase [Acidobacteriota bacterium]
MSQHPLQAGIVPASIILCCLLTVSAVCAEALPELQHLPRDTQVLVGVEWKSGEDAAAAAPMYELILSLFGLDDQLQRFTEMTALKPGEQIGRVVFASIPLSDGRKATVGFASGEKIGAKSGPSVGHKDGFSVVVLGEQVVFGDPSAVKICSSLSSRPSAGTLADDAGFVRGIERVRSAASVWGQVRPSGLSAISNGNENWSFRGARSRVRLIQFSAKPGRDSSFSMVTETGSESDTEILADELRELFRQFGSDGVAELRPVASKAEVKTEGTSVRLDLALPAPAAKRLKGSRTAQSILMWELPALTRENSKRVSDVFRHLGLMEKGRIADVGAGEGFFTVRLARAVGPDGRIWAVDISPRVIQSLQKRIESTVLKNVIVVLGEPADPKLASGTLDAVLIVNSYHEMPHYSEMLDRLFRAIRPGGRIVISEPFNPKSRSLARDKQIENHEIAPELVEEELRKAGFEILFRDDAFIETRESTAESILVARRPNSQ